MKFSQLFAENFICFVIFLTEDNKSMDNSESQCR